MDLAVERSLRVLPVALILCLLAGTSECPADSIRAKKGSLLVGWGMLGAQPERGIGGGYRTTHSARKGRFKSIQGRFFLGEHFGMGFSFEKASERGTWRDKYGHSSHRSETEFQQLSLYVNLLKTRISPYLCASGGYFERDINDPFIDELSGDGFVAGFGAGVDARLWSHLTLIIEAQALDYTINRKKNDVDFDRTEVTALIGVYF